MDKVGKVYSAITAVAGALSKQGIGKDQKNTMQGYEFRGIDDLYNVLGPILAEHKLCILPRVLARETIEGKTKKGGVSFHTMLDVEFDLVSAEDGSCHAVRTQGESIDTSDKSVNKALIAAYKYLAFIMFCIPVKGMADADRDTPEIEPTASPPRPDPASRELPQGGGDTLMTEQQVKDCEAAVRAILKEIETLGGATEKEIADGVVKELVAGQGGFPALTKNEADHMYMALKDQYKKLKKAEERKEAE